MIDQNYVGQMEHWFKSMELSIQQAKNYIKFHEDEIKLHTEFKSCYEKMLPHDEARFEKSKLEFEEYLKNNSDEQQ
jgi:hypothetical protein